MRNALFPVVAVAFLGAVGCKEVSVTYSNPTPPARPVGEACTVDIECATGRCVAGVCDDGGCNNDDDCRNDELCVFGACEPADEFACQPDQAPLLSRSPSGTIEFGEVNIGTAAEQVITITNLGDCLLTLSAAGLLGTGSPDFSCDRCDPTIYPQRIPPNRTLDITVGFSPTSAGDAASQLLINSDDLTAGDEGHIAIDLHAAYSGEPTIVVEPLEANFDFVAVGNNRTIELQVTNRGTGNAALIITNLFVESSTQFTIPPEAGISQLNPRTLGRYNPDVPDTILTVPVTFAPQGTPANHAADLVITAANMLEPLRVPLTGSSLGPPQITVSATEFQFKCQGSPLDPCPAPEAYPVGIVAYRQFTITNSGQSNLNVNMTLGGEAGDFSVSPSFVPPISPGGVMPITVFFNPSAPSDPANRFNPIEAFDAVLNITSNDTDPATDVLKTVVLKGFSKGGQNDQVLKLEMNYENADNSWAGNDYRDVDLELVSPTGFSCAKPIRTWAESPPGSGNYQVISEEDLCDEWNAYGQEGQANWIALGQYEEPERIIVFGLGPTGAEGGVFRANVYYIEDCANIPTGLLANILGIGGSILLGILGGAVGIPITVPPDQISDMIANNCFDHASSMATLHISRDGVEDAAPQVRLGSKGEVREIATLTRTNGQFCNASLGVNCQ